MDRFFHLFSIQISPGEVFFSHGEVFFLPEKFLSKTEPKRHVFFVFFSKFLPEKCIFLLLENFFFLPEKNTFSGRTFFFSGRNFISKLSQNIPQILTDLKKKFSRRRRFSPGEVFSSPGEDFSSPGEVLP